MTRDPLSDLQAVLALEKHALLSGAYGDLDALGQEKEQLIQMLSAAPPSRNALLALRQQIETNQSLTEAALRGVQAAQTRIAALRQVQSGLTTYERDGTVATRRSDTPSVERKA